MNTLKEQLAVKDLNARKHAEENRRQDEHARLGIQAARIIIEDCLEKIDILEEAAEVGDHQPLTVELQAELIYLRANAARYLKSFK